MHGVLPEPFLQDVVCNNVQPARLDPSKSGWRPASQSRLVDGFGDRSFPYAADFARRTSRADGALGTNGTNATD